MKNKSLKNQSFDARKAIGIAMIVVSAFLLFCLITRGLILSIVGSAVADFFLGIFGIFAYALMAGLLAAGIMVLLGKRIMLPKLQIVNFAVMAFALMLLIQFMTSGGFLSNGYSAYLSACYDFAHHSTFGGAFAGLFAWPLCHSINIVGAYIFVIALLILTVFICFEYFFKISNIHIEKSREIVKEDTYRQAYPQNTLFVATINDGSEAKRPQIRQDVQPTVTRSQNDPMDTLYGENNPYGGYKGQTESTNSRGSAFDQLYGGMKRNDQPASVPPRSFGDSYLGGYEKDNSEPQVTTNISNAPPSNGPFIDPPAIMHTDEPYPSVEDHEIKKTEETVKESSSNNKPRVDKEKAIQDLYALQAKNGDVEDSTLPPIVNGDEVSENLKRKRLYEQKVAKEEAARKVALAQEQPLTSQTQQEESVQQQQQIEEVVVEDNIETNIVEQQPVQTPISTVPFVKVKDKTDEEVNFSENEELKSPEDMENISEADLLNEGELKNISIGEMVADDVVTDEYAEEEETEEKDDEGVPVEFTEEVFKTNNEGINGRQIVITPQTDEEKEEEKPIHVYKKYVPPIFQLLDDAVFDPNVGGEDFEKIGENIAQTLAQFRIEAKFVNYVHGPTVTRYEYEMAPGISVKRVMSYVDDISMAVSAKSSVRIEAPIPGKNLFGIEVPNSKIAKVPLRSVLESPEFLTANNALTVALGIDIGGQKIITDLADLPHLLIAGTTGQGKSVCMNSIVVSLLYKYGPEDLRFIFVDTKQVEFTVYKRLPHLMINEIITEPEKAINAFNWLIKEMERRFKLFSEYSVRDITGYNRVIDKETVQKLPRIVLMIDEAADLMSYNKAEIEQRIQRLAQKSRAAGIHIVLATQRPSVDIITGVIKANFPARIALRVMSSADAKTILPNGGPEKLCCKGDMLFQKSNEPIRLQGALILDDEVKSVVDYIAENNEECYFDPEVKDEIFNGAKAAQKPGQDSADEVDELFCEAVKYVIEAGQASISMLQRRFGIGYNKAGRLIQDMEERGIISGFDGAKPRSVKMTLEEVAQRFGIK